MTGHFNTGFPTVDPGGGAYFVASNYTTTLLIAKFNLNSQIVWGTYFGAAGTVGDLAKLTLGACDEIYLSLPSAPYAASQPPMEILNPGNGAYCDSIYDNSLNNASPDIYIAAFVGL